MPVTQDKPGPYAPSTAILAIVERYRDRGMPTPISAEVLLRAGISDSLVPRTLHALQTLDLISETGQPTPVFESIRLAPEAEYKARLGEWLSNAYADVLMFIDPASADEAELHDAFRSYNPAGQRGRMVTLFTGLFRAAGIMPEKASGAAPKKPVIVHTVRRTPRSSVAAKSKETPGRGGHSPKPASFDGALPPAIAGLLASLPTHGEGWTKPQRDAFMNAFGVVLDFVFPPGVVKPKTAEAHDDADA